MGFYPPDALVHEAQRRGVEVSGPDVNASAVLCTVEGAAEGDLAVRIGLGYVKGLAERDAEAVVAERERGGAYRDLTDLAARSGAGRDGLERLAWAGACGDLGAGDRRRVPLWRLGAAAASGDQLALPLPLPEAPALNEQTPWERLTADYGAYGIALEEHPLALLRDGLDPATVTCEALARIADGSKLTVAGLLVARQRPATARGVMFLLIEDETGVANVIVVPPVYERHRLTVRTASLVSVSGRLERREGVINVVAAAVRPLERPEGHLADVRQIEPSPARETGRAISDLDAVLPAAHSFGRRGR
jgi:error-prone DNA polymerase